MTTKVSKGQAKSAKPSALANQYRAIGPAAIAAALLCVTKKKAAIKLA